MGWAWDPSHFARAAPGFRGGGAPEGSVLTPKAPPGTAAALAKAEGRLQKRLGQEPAPADGAAGHGPAGSCPRQPGAPAWACGLGSGILCGPSQRFPEKAGGLGEERAPSRPPTLQLGSLCACFLQRCRPRGRVASSPESISQVTLVSHKRSGQEGPSDSTWSS